MMQWIAANWGWLLIVWTVASVVVGAAIGRIIKRMAGEE